MQFPQMVTIQQTFDRPRVENVADTIHSELRRISLADRVKPGWHVAIGVGSRGIACIPAVVAAVVSEVKLLGANPFIVPAMGSHGAATAEGQKSVLEDLGVQEAVVGAPIRATMEAIEVGHLEGGMPVYIDRNAYGADAIIVVNRIKPHTVVGHRIGSGVMKIMAIGLGKQKGCSTIHRHAYGNPDGPYPLIEQVARLLMEKTPIVAGIGIVDNAYAEPAHIVAMSPGEIPELEPKLFSVARSLLPSLPVSNLDVLIVDRMGKNISPSGLDPFVIGDRLSGSIGGSPCIKRVVVLDLTDASHGNAVGIGAADLIPQRLLDKVDRKATYMNCISGSRIENAKIPVTMETDREAIEVAFKTIGAVEAQEARVIRVRSTLELGTMLVSQSLVADVTQEARVKVIGQPVPLVFDANGSLI